MGNNHGKKGCTEDCERNLDELFSSLSRNTSAISFNDLKKKWAPQLDPYLYTVIESHLKKEGSSGVKREHFKSLFIELCKCNSDGKSKSILRLISNGESVSREKLLQFVVSVVRSVLIIQRNKCMKIFNSWSVGPPKEDEEVSAKHYGCYVLRALDKDAGGKDYDADDIRLILNNLDIFLTMTLSAIYDTEDKDFYSHLLPIWRHSHLDYSRKLEEVSVLDPIKIMFINFELPIDYQDEWRLLFSSAIDGESFSRLTGQITNKGPTVLIVKDKGDHVFGGFAPESWSLGPTFKGDSSSFLFTLNPEMLIFPQSNFNTNYQYLNTGQQTMPNGLGMGGRLEYFGLWLSAEFGHGSCSESCTTYRNYKMMSSSKSFKLDHLEVWGVGPPPPTPAELGERSVLDGNIEAKAILELAGKQTFSEGYRDNPEKTQSEFS